MHTLLTILLFPVAKSALFLQALGLVCALMGFRKSARKGYLVIAAFFALALLAPLVEPSWRRMHLRLMETSAPQLVRDMRENEKLNAEINKAVFEVYEREGITTTPKYGYSIQFINFRFDLLLLVIGLWWLQAGETTKVKPAQKLYGKVDF